VGSRVLSLSRLRCSGLSSDVCIPVPPVRPTSGLVSARSGGQVGGWKSGRKEEDDREGLSEKSFLKTKQRLRVLSSGL
jgi:hypothetical protein